MVATAYQAVQTEQVQEKVPDEKPAEEKRRTTWEPQIATRRRSEQASRGKKESAPLEDAATAPSDKPLRRLRAKSAPKDATAKIIAGVQECLKSETYR